MKYVIFAILIIIVVVLLARRQQPEPFIPCTAAQVVGATQNATTAGRVVKDIKCTASGMYVLTAPGGTR